MDGIMTIGTDAIPVLLDWAYDNRKDFIPCLIGAPGIGKTEMVHQFAKSKGVKVVEMNLNQCLPSEVSGMAMPDNENQLLTYYDDQQILEAKDGDILFLDEVLTASSVVFNATLKLLNDRRMRSGRPINDVLIIAAGNHVPVKNIKYPVRQRFQFYEIKWNKNTWKSFVEKELHITLSKDILNMVQVPDDDTQSWNVLTPRNAFKFLRCMCDDEERTKRIMTMTFGRSVADAFAEVSESEFLEPWSEDEVRRTAESVFGLDVSGMAIEDIYKYLMSDEAKEISMEVCHASV